MAPFQLDPPRIAELEGGGWRAYYDRDWPKLIRLMVQLNQEQFHIPFPLSVVAAFHVARGSVAWAPVDHDLDRVRAALRALLPHGAALVRPRVRSDYRGAARNRLLDLAP